MISTGGSSAQVVVSKVVDIKTGVGVGDSEGQKTTPQAVKSRVERSMAVPTREEIDAKIETISARMDAKFESILGEIKVTNLNINNLATSISDIRIGVSDVRADNKYTRWTIIGTVIVVSLTAIGLVLSIQGNLLSALQASLTIKQSSSQLQASQTPQEQVPKAP